MEEKSRALFNSLKHLDDIEKGITGDVVDGPQLLASKLNAFADSLSRVFDQGRTMDESTIFKVPMDLIEYMDLDGDTNFDSYLKQKESERETNARTMSDRVKYLQTLSENLKTDLDK